jgi:hypothetical protein
MAVAIEYSELMHMSGLTASVSRQSGPWANSSTFSDHCGVR